MKYVFVTNPYNRGMLGKLRLCGGGRDSGYVSTHGARQVKKYFLK